MQLFKFAVIGIGHFGKSIALNLMHKGAEVMAIDSNYEKIENISDEVSYAVTLNATDRKALLSQDITSFDAVIISIGNPLEQRLLCAALLLDLGVKRIVCRAMGRNERFILKKMGITDIISPEQEVGILVARRLMNPSLVSSLDLPDDYSVMEIVAPKHICGLPYAKINFRDKYKLSLITIKRDFSEDNAANKENSQHVLGVPDTKTVILSRDTLVLFGKNKDIEKFVEINN
ncbi:MAG: TrkA family potassium uptake protein [Bacteroidales bacterium]|jgi:trk system potassium uptake protein TrkA|nr:TrkA family potassium uptake protein [Bacteroidales bacterium]MDD3691360.1 TrkA family potassium uptake protein [Bacteroidales bacterium]NLO42133.1 TrkA family potassium uptake protein [Bacteroidales bacterium]